MAFRTDIEAIVLAALRSGPKHGYDIIRTIRELGNEVLKLGEGQLYPILHRLEEEGKLSSDWDNMDTQRPRRIYTLTATGNKALAGHKRKWNVFRSTVDSLLLATKEESTC